MSLLDITNSFLFEREVWFPDDRSVAKNPNHDCPPTTNTLGNQKPTQGFLYRFKCTKNESHWAHQIHWPRRRQEWRQRRQPSKGLCQSQKEVWGLKDIVFLIFHIFDNFYVELAKLWLYLKSEPVCLFSDPIFVHLSPSPLSERTNFLSQPRVFMIYILAHPLGCSICVEIFHVNCVSENFAQLQHALGSRLPGHKLTQPCLWPWLSC